MATVPNYPTNIHQLNRLYRAFEQAVLKAYGRHAATFTCMAPSRMGDKDSNTDNCTLIMTTHLPTDPRVRVDEVIPFTDIKGMSPEDAERHLNNRADKFKRNFQYRTRRAAEVAANERKVDDNV